MPLPCPQKCHLCSKTFLGSDCIPAHPICPECKEKRDNSLEFRGDSSTPEIAIIRKEANGRYKRIDLTIDEVRAFVSFLFSMEIPL